ncbi:hypothetical protein ABIA33_005741 [Streptacidiphilus sp. MAP12-16]|uniref:(2Fe-2S)-binding protein n=1 Tax=Streptacidiphilus sp. MAP12-16 TaxID=3156300 RepID=UPI003516F9F0
MLLTDTYRRLAHVCDDLRVEVLETRQAVDGPGGTWLSMAELVADPEMLAAALDGESARILAAHGSPARSDVAASRLLHRQLWSVGLLISGPWFLAGQVPRLTPDRLWTDPVSGDFALAPGDFDVTATDAPQAVRASVEEFVRPLLNAFRPRVRRGPRALWGMAGDDLVSGLWYLGRTLGEEQRAVHAAESLLPGPGGTGPFPDGANFRTIHGPSGRLHLTRTRTGCCLNYTIKQGRACGTCPRLSDTERLRRLEAAPA